MLSSTSGGEDHEFNLNINHHHLSSTSTTPSSSSSSTLFTLNKITARTMEEVWKDITLSSFHNHSSAARPAAAAGPAAAGFIFQDFLGKPFSRNDTPTSVSSPGYGSPSPPPPEPTMLLNLNSGPDQLNFLGDDPTLNVMDGPTFDHVMASTKASSGYNIGGLRVLPATERGGGERRHKRMIKNRESAARSRARKQAYTNELEIEVERLKEENARLKKQRQQLQVVAAAEITKKGSLQRTSTAPF